MVTRMKTTKILPCTLALLFALALPVSALAQPQPQPAFAEGRVAAIVSGDTLRVDVPGHGQWRVRLAWVAAPALRQAHGEAARSGLNALAAGQAVRLENPRATGGEWVARVWAPPPGARCGDAGCPPTLDLGQAQIERGWAWHDRRTPGQGEPAASDYAQAEFMAKIRRLGLWAGQNPVPPWAWQGPR
jgi:endonuclease YncB( thermonuclease family)